jgi:hypothetical protein
MTLTGALLKRWIVSHDCPVHFENTTELHQYVPVGKFITDILLKFELARSLPSVNPQPTLDRYSQRNTDFLFPRSPVVSVIQMECAAWKGCNLFEGVAFRC